MFLKNPFFQVITLNKGDKGLGFSILDYQDPLNMSETVIVVRSLVPGGVAQVNMIQYNTIWGYSTGSGCLHNSRNLMDHNENNDIFGIFVLSEARAFQWWFNIVSTTYGVKIHD